MHMLIVPDGFDAHPSHLPRTPVARAAGLARAAMIFRKQLKQGILEPDTTKEGPICMDTFRYLTFQSNNMFLTRAQVDVRLLPRTRSARPGLEYYTRETWRHG